MMDGRNKALHERGRRKGREMAKELTGKEVTEAMAADVQARVAVLKERGITPTLAIVRVGENESDLSYERTALKRAETFDVAVEQIVLPESTTTEELLTTIEQVNSNDAIHGCLLFRPLPKHIDEPLICDALAAEKDIDGIGSAALASVFTGTGAGFAPSTAAACIQMLDHYNIPIEGKHAVVIGRSLVIGKPVACLLLDRNATVTVCHSRTENLAEVTRQADIVIAATGRAKAYGADYFSPGQTVLDVGINFDDDGLCGDCDFASVEPIVDAITPVPRGLGGVTTSITMEHTVAAAEHQNA